MQEMIQVTLFSAMSGAIFTMFVALVAVLGNLSPFFLWAQQKAPFSMKWESCGRPFRRIGLLCVIMTGTGLLLSVHYQRPSLEVSPWIWLYFWAASWFIAYVGHGFLNPRVPRNVMLR